MENLPSIEDLFGRTRLLKEGKMLNERSSVLAFFSDEVSRPGKVVAIRLSHYSLDELHALKSAYQDRKLRNSPEAALKYWWYITRTYKEGSVPVRDVDRASTGEAPERAVPEVLRVHTEKEAG